MKVQRLLFLPCRLFMASGSRSPPASCPALPASSSVAPLSTSSLVSSAAAPLASSSAAPAPRLSAPPCAPMSPPASPGGAPATKRVKTSHPEALVREDWSYHNKLILAPMVRVGTLPMRLLAAQHGADIVYSEEVIAKKFIKCRRQVNQELGTVEFLDPHGRLVFATVPGEPVVFQMGTCSAEEAVRAASLVQQDVRAIDVNMGCPKHFSISGGMGVGLLTNPENVQQVLLALRRQLPARVALTCKIRLLDEESKTLALLKMIEQCGVSAIGVHARRLPDRPTYRALIEQIPRLVKAVKVPILYNGDIFERSDIPRCRALSGASSLMIARGAQWNPSIFNENGMRPIQEMLEEYMALSKRYRNHVVNSKYVLQGMLQGHASRTAQFAAVCRARSLEELETAVLDCRSIAILSEPYKCHFVPSAAFVPRPEDLPSDTEFLQGTRGSKKEVSRRSRAKQRETGKGNKEENEEKANDVETNDLRVSDVSESPNDSEDISLNITPGVACTVVNAGHKKA
eukprot:g28832.t1